MPAVAAVAAVVFAVPLFAEDKAATVAAVAAILAVAFVAAVGRPASHLDGRSHAKQLIQNRPS